MTKTFSILILAMLLQAKSVQHNALSGKWIVERSSSINIQGETNVNKFQCDVTEYLGNDTLVYSSNDAARKLNFSNSALQIDVKRFDCHSKFITSDFRSALKVDENPQLKIRFISLDQFSSPCDQQAIKGIVDIELAKVTRRVEICYTIKTLGANRIALTGNHVFTFSDFNLKAPRKLAGLIRTKDKIKVNFQLYFKTI